MKKTIILVWMILVFIILIALTSLRVIGFIKNQTNEKDLNAVYSQATEFINDLYDQNIEATYSQLESRDQMWAAHDGYVSKEDWTESVKKNIDTETLNKIVKPSSASDISDILHSNEPHETYQVNFILSVNFEG